MKENSHQIDTKDHLGSLEGVGLDEGGLLTVWGSVPGVVMVPQLHGYGAVYFKMLNFMLSFTIIYFLCIYPTLGEPLDVSAENRTRTLWESSECS